MTDESIQPNSANLPMDKILHSDSLSFTAKQGFDATPRTIHGVTQSKGGCGKSLVAWILTQYLRDRKRPVSAIDLDTMTHSLVLYKGLSARAVDLLAGQDINAPAMDQLASDMLTSSDDFVLDNGASGFTALTGYLTENAFVELLSEHDAQMVLHVVLAGGPAASQCLMGLITLLEAFEGSKVRFIAWVNEHEEPFTVNGKTLDEMPARQYLAGIVRLKQLSKWTLADFKAMRSAEDPLTFSEALASPKFFIMNQQRLKLVRDGLWAQLDKLELT